MELQLTNPISISALNLRMAEQPSEAGFERELASATARKKVREASQQFVASAFILPMLQQMSSDPLLSDLMHGGFAEDAWQSQLNTILADRITMRSNLPLVDAIEEKIMKQYDAIESGRKALNTHG